MIITGIYGKTIYRDHKSGRCIFTFTTRDTTPNKITCLGSCQMYPTDMPLKLEGEIKDGEFYFNKCAPYINTREKMIDFLAGKTFKGIGEKTAEKIYDFVDGSIFDFVEKDYAEAELTNVFGSQIAKELVSKIRELDAVRKIYDLISPYKGTMTAATKISEIASIEEFVENIYEYGKEGGLSFGSCDGLAKSLKYSPYDERRIDALLHEAVNNATSAGHIYTDIRDITKKVKKICKSSAYEEDIPPPLLLISAFKNRKYRIKESEGEIRYYPSYLYNSENSVANGVLRIQQSSTSFPFEEKIIEEIEERCRIKYSESQKNALRLLKSSGVKILTGGPGTGKSTVINGIVRIIRKMFPKEKILLCAPTGRAAQRLKEVTGVNSLTIHRALNIKPFGDTYVATEPIEAKFIIVDEASMIDTVLLEHLITAVPSGAFVLFCGDTEQLPSVGPGNVLKDMIASKKIDVITLDVVYRCLEDSLISYNAHNIQMGNTEIKTGKDFHFFSFETEDEMKNKIEEIIRAKHDKSDPFSVQVLSPVKDGNVGVKVLNKSLQQICNERVGSYMTYDSFKYKIADKIIMIKNNYTEGYFNGDIGTVREINEDSMLVSLGDDTEILLQKKSLEDVAPAYALTVHKSQGSEFSTVIVVLPEEPGCMLQKNLLYTAITRAKKDVYIISQKDSYSKAVNNTKIAERNTSLKKKLSKGVFIYG